MKSTTLIIVILALVVGGGIGYATGKGSNDGSSDKALEESIVMMREQSDSIQEMAELMKSGGMMMQQAGTKYNDNDMMSLGKDMQMTGENHMKANIEASGSGMMKGMMH